MVERSNDPRKRRSNRKRAEQTAQSLIAALLLGTASGCATIDTPPYNGAYARPPARRPMPATVHSVAPGETLNSIARSYGVPRQAIVDANDIDDPDSLRRGQRLTIPFVTSRPRMAAPRPAPVAPRVVAQALPSPTMKPIVEADEPQPDPRLLGARYYALGTPRSKPVLDGQGGPEFFAPPPREERVASIDLDAPYDPRAAKAKVRAKPKAEPVGEASSSGQFIWPVRGKVLLGFGRRGSGMHNDGINIAAEPNTPVRAADGGVVVYAGNELAGYGNLLLVRHASGYVTAYAHNKKLLVDRGDRVKQGETIALVGATGDVEEPQLHFEIRKGDRAVDPNRFLVRQTASR